jgi:cytochrome P450
LGHVIPKGTNILLVPFAINFSKSLWGPDALEFNPERWLGPNCLNSGGSTSNFANMTFIHGMLASQYQGRAYGKVILMKFQGRAHV